VEPISMTMNSGWGENGLFKNTDVFFGPLKKPGPLFLANRKFGWAGDGGIFFFLIFCGGPLGAAFPIGIY